MLTETFESFPNYVESGFSHLADPTDIFGGAASLGGEFNSIYEPSEGDSFGLGENGDAGLADGAKGMGVRSADATATITFDGTVTDFGGFFNAGELASLGFTDTVTFSFFDAAFSLIDTETFDVAPGGGGTLNFYGFNSTTPVKIVTITGDFVAMDSLRVDGVVNPGAGTAPEPASLALFALVGGVAFVARRRERKHS